MLYVICTLLVLAVFGLAYIFRLLVSDEFEYSDRLPSPSITHDDLSEAILNLINDTYSTFFQAELSDHICSDLGIDSLDFVDLLFDISQIVGTELNGKELYDKYGRNPTIAQLISFVRSSLPSQ